MPCVSIKPGSGVLVRQLAVLVRELVTHARFSSSADLLDALEGECRRLRLPYRRELANDALDLVGSNLRLLPPAAPGRVEPQTPLRRGLTHAEATAVLTELVARLGGSRA